jgi:hypothetical protein
MKIKRSKLKELSIQFEGNDSLESQNRILIKIATARCARLSYMTFDGEIDYEKDIKLHDHLLESGHMSPFEHCARVMNEDEYESWYSGDGHNERHTGKKDYHGWCKNFRGFIQYRELLEKVHLVKEKLDFYEKEQNRLH